MGLNETSRYKTLTEELKENEQNCYDLPPRLQKMP